MTKVTVTIDSKSNARLFLEMLKAFSFVKNVESENVYDDTLSKEEIKILEERWETYLSDPKSFETWEQVKAEMMRKHGR